MIAVEKRNQRKLNRAQKSCLQAQTDHGPQQPAQVVAGGAQHGIQRIAQLPLEPAAIHPVIRLEVVFEKGHFVSRGLDTQHTTKLVVHLDRVFAQSMFVASTFDSRGHPTPVSTHFNQPYRPPTNYTSHIDTSAGAIAVRTIPNLASRSAPHNSFALAARYTNDTWTKQGHRYLNENTLFRLFFARPPLLGGSMPENVSFE